MNSGVMFVATPGNQVIALDAKSGQLIWRYRRPLPEGVVLLHPTSRGVALHGDKVLFAAGEAVLVALDAKTGKEIWTTTVADNSQGYYMSLAPLVVGSTVMIGASGGEFGVRGFIAAYDVENGRERWKTYMVPAPGEPGSETWPKGDQWKTGGGSVWVTGNYDPETNLAFWGTGNGGPWMGDQRPGRQPIHVSHRRDRRGYRRHQRPLSIPSERLVGLGRSVAADPRGLPAQRPHRQRPGRRGSQRLSLVSRAHQRPHQFCRGQAVCEARRVYEPRSEERAAQRRSGAPSPAPTSAPSSARRIGAARTGRPSPIAPTRG